MPNRRPCKLDPALYVGPHRIFLTMCTLDRRRSFEDGSVVGPSRAELLRTAADYRVELTAYVFMPDHLHGLIIGLADDSDLLKCMDMFRQRTGFAHKRSEEHTSELQSQSNIVCRLLLEKKKKKKNESPI